MTISIVRSPRPPGTVDRDRPATSAPSVLERRMLMFGLLSAYCTGGCTPDLSRAREMHEVQGFSVSPEQLNLSVGQTSRIVASAQYRDGVFEDIPTPHRNLRWHSNSDEIASVSEDGTVEGLAPGTAMVFANLEIPEGDKAQVFSDSVQITVGGGGGDLRIDNVTPNHGPRSGETEIRIEGAGFFDVVSVRIGVNELNGWVAESPSVISGRTPPFAGGETQQDVIVQTRSQGEARLFGGFSYDEASTPVITMLSPPRVTAGSADADLVILGMNFIGDGSQVRMSGDGFSRDLTLVGGPQTTTELHVEIPAGLSIGTYGVVVTNGPDGEPSPPFNFFVDAPSGSRPSIAALSPSRTTAGSPEFQLNITGTNFDGPSVTFNGEIVVQPTPGDSTIIVATIPGGLVERPGRYPVVVTNAFGPNQGVSNAVDFIVDPPGMSGGFDANDVIVSNPGPGDDDVTAIATDGSVSFYVAGNYDDMGDRAWRIEKRSIPGGELDPSFGTSGVLTVNPSPGADFLADLAIDGTHMYLAGADFSPGAGNDQWRIEKRSLQTGALDPNFGGSGFIVNNLSGGLDEVTGIAIDPAGESLFIFGLDSSNGNRQWRVEKRSTINGGPDPGFPSGGVTINPSSGHDDTGPIVLDGGAFYIGGIDRTPGNGQWRVEARQASDGTLIPSFNAGGVLTVDPGPLDDRVHSIAIHNGQLYIAGVDTSLGSSNEQWRIEKRRQSDAALDPDFGAGGVIRSNASSAPDAPFAIAFDPAGKLYLGGYDSAPQDRWRIERRETFGGALDMSFAQGGVSIYDSPGLDRVNRLLSVGSDVYAIGLDSGPGNRAWRIQRLQGDI